MPSLVEPTIPPAEPLPAFWVEPPPLPKDYDDYKRIYPPSLPKTTEDHDSDNLTMPPEHSKKRSKKGHTPPRDPPPAKRQKHAPSAPGPAPNPIMSHATNKPGSSDDGELKPSDSNSSLGAAFETPYVGTTSRLFLQTLNRERESAGRPIDQQPYNWSISVIQSSGMGKSRMVDEAANSIFTLVINIREDLPGGQQTYPLSDSMVRKYFEGHGDKSDTQLQAEGAIFLRVLLDEAAKLVQTDDKLRGLTGSALARAFAKRFKEGESDAEVGNNRKVFFDAVVGKAKKRRSSLDSPSVTEVKDLTKRLKSSCKKFIATISPDYDVNKTACLVCFDEAHILTDTAGINNKGRTRTPYHNLGKVLSDLVGEPLFFVFLSTNSHLERFAPANFLHPSVRVYNGRRLIPPFTELPFDVFKERVLNNKKELTLSVACSTEVVSVYGRAMWHVHYRNNLNENIFEFAMNKLSAGASFNQPFTPLLAALTVRIGINFDTRTQASRALDSKLVESHLRVVYAIPEHREFMNTGSPSEPMLAEAAARYLTFASEPDGFAVIGPKTLAQACENDFLALGERGELCGRLLLTIAHDLALHEPSAKLGASKETQFHRPVSVLKFLRALIAEQYHEKVLGAGSVTCKPGVPNLEQAFANCLVFFSHFAIAKDSEMLSSTSLAGALVRGMAIQAKNGLVSIDAVIPVHMGTSTTPISPATTSAINLQFKNRQRASPCHVDRTITVEDLERPVLSIVFEFGANPPEGTSHVHVQELQPRKTRKGGECTHRDDHHYEIVIYGRHAGAYRAIPKEAESHYDLILGQSGFEKNFVRRQHPENLSAMWNLKPDFSGKQNEYDKWFKTEAAGQGGAQAGSSH